MVFLTPTVDVSILGDTLGVGNVNASTINIGQTGTNINLNGTINVNGNEGSIGTTGVTGVTGVTGWTGVSGATGPAGPAGSGYGAIDTSSNEIIIGDITQSVRIPGTFSVNNLSVDISGNLTTPGDITANLFMSTSDYRLKENIKYLTNDSFSLELLKPCTFNFKNSMDTKLGFIAHELQEVIPYAVKGEKDGNIQTVDYSAVISACVLKIQTIMKDVETNTKDIQDIKQQMNMK